MKEILLGMDPGKDGFITAWDGEEFKFYAMPTHKVDTGNLLKSGKPQMKDEFHIGGLAILTDTIKYDFPNCRFVVAIEEVGGRGGNGAVQNFNFGFVAGLQRMVFEMLLGEIIMVRPQKWQSVVRRGYNKKDAKAMAEHIATTEYPNIDFRKTERARKNHDGKIDSFLICLYLMRTRNPISNVEENIRLGQSTII